jgi:hypothetical protein
LEVLDTLLFKLICRPDGDDLAVIAAELKENETLRGLPESTWMCPAMRRSAVSSGCHERDCTGA